MPFIFDFLMILPICNNGHVQNQIKNSLFQKLRRERLKFCCFSFCGILGSYIICENRVPLKAARGRESFLHVFISLHVQSRSNQKANMEIAMNGHNHGAQHIKAPDKDSMT